MKHLKKYCYILLTFTTNNTIMGLKVSLKSHHSNFLTLGKQKGYLKFLLLQLMK